MRRYGRAMWVGLVAGLLLAGLWFAGTSEAFTLVLSAEKGLFSSGIFLADGTSPSFPPAASTIFYTKTLTVPDLFSASQFLVIHLAAATAQHNGIFVAAGCFVDGAACNPADAFVLGIPGWVSVTPFTETGATTFSFNTSYTWCVGPVPPGSHTVQLAHANNSGVSGNSALWQAHVTISVARTNQGACTESF